VLVKGEILAAQAPFSPQKHPKINFKPPFSPQKHPKINFKPPFKHFHAVFTPISPFFIILDIFHQMQRPLRRCGSFLFLVLIQFRFFCQHRHIHFRFPTKILIVTIF
jgi:hypothetical protein